MISAGSAVSDRSTAPSTDCSASRFCGGASAPSTPRGWPLLTCGALIGRPSLGGPPDEHTFWFARCAFSRARVAKCDRALLLLDDHRLDGRRDAVGHLDVDHARADRADRLLQVDLAAVDADPARLADRVRDVLRRDRA